MKSVIQIGLILLSIFFISCNPNSDRDIHKLNVENWRSKRLKDLKSPDGWTTLAGLFWLKPGKNFCGSSDSMDLIFPKTTPPTLGIFELKNNKVSFTSNSEIKIVDSKNNRISNSAMYPYDSIPPKLSWNAHQWYVIKRGDKFGIRLRDTLHPNRQMLKAIPAYPTNYEWKIDANVSYQDTNKTILIENILGQKTPTRVAATLTFQIQDNVYELQAIDGGQDEFFVIFSDETTGSETYGGGRYIYPLKPKNGYTTNLDFNLAYNPPCVFTEFATCPLPPSENHLAIRIPAGEKYSKE